MAQALASDPKVFMLGEDIGVYGGAFGVTKDLIEEFGKDRVRDTPISENAIMGAATGAAVLGMRPIAEMQFKDFITLGMEQTVLQAAKIRYMFGGKATVPMVVRHAGRVGHGRGGAALREPGVVVPERAGHEGRRAGHARTTRRGCCWPPSRTTTRSCSWRTSCSTRARARCRSILTSYRWARRQCAARVRACHRGRAPPSWSYRALEAAKTAGGGGDRARSDRPALAEAATTTRPSSSR